MPATQNAGQSSSPTPTPEKKSGGGTNVAGVAAGVVVGVLAAAALAAGLILWIRHRKRQAAEEEYKRSNQVTDFMRGSHGNEPKPPPTAYSQMSDSRLDPEANARRNSAGSIADDQDYSRRILRVCTSRSPAPRCMAHNANMSYRWRIQITASRTMPPAVRSRTPTTSRPG